MGHILDRLARDLNDAAPGHEFTAWPKDQLRTYVIEACRTFDSIRPNKFDQLRLLVLEGCQDFHDVCPCSKLTATGILGQADSSGNVFGTIKARPDGPAGQWPGKACPPGDPFRIREYTLSDDGGSVRVYPNVPPGRTAYLSVRCAVFPDEDDSEVPDDVVPAVIQWALFRAKMVDGENNAAIVTVAAQHRATFSMLLGVKDPGAGRSRTDNSL
jgi:hypothetical protein